MKKVLMICFMLAMIICIGGCNKNVGKLYTLEEAYDLNLITKDDLKNITIKISSDDISFNPIDDSISEEVNN